MLFSVSFFLLILIIAHDLKKVSEYDQEMPQSLIAADQPQAP